MALTNNTVQKQLDQWQDKLQSVLTAVRKLDVFSQWIGEAQRSLTSFQEQGVRTSVEGVQQQLEQLKVTLRQHYQ